MTNQMDFLDQQQAPSPMVSIHHASEMERRGMKPLFLHAKEAQLAMVDATLRYYGIVPFFAIPDEESIPSATSFTVYVSWLVDREQLKKELKQKGYLQTSPAVHLIDATFLDDEDEDEMDDEGRVPNER